MEEKTPLNCVSSPFLSSETQNITNLKVVKPLFRRWLPVMFSSAPPHRSPSGVMNSQRNKVNMTYVSSGKFMKEGCVGYYGPRAMANDTPVTSVGFLSPFQLPLSLKFIINYSGTSVFERNPFRKDIRVLKHSKTDMWFPHRK